MSASSQSVIKPQPDADLLSRFIVGQDDSGQWIALETHGLGGGFFRSRKDALRYALGETVGRPEAVSISDDRIAIRM